MKSRWCCLLSASVAGLLACAPLPGTVDLPTTGHSYGDSDVMMRSFIPSYRVGMSWSYRFYPIGSTRMETEQDPNRFFREEVSQVEGSQVMVIRPGTPGYKVTLAPNKPYPFSSSTISRWYTFQATEDVTVPYGVVKNAYRFSVREVGIPFLGWLKLPVSPGSSEELVWFATTIGAVKTATIYPAPSGSNAATSELVSFDDRPPSP